MSGKYALIIANTEYTDPGLAQLTAPGKDAEDFAHVLNAPDIAAFDKVSIFTNENVFTLNEAIEGFFSERKPDDLLVFYFSGHGVRDDSGSLFLAVKNTNRARLRSTAIKADFVREMMDQSRSHRQTIILDCCNSGAFAHGTKAATGGSMGFAPAFEGKGYGRVVLTATDSTQFAWEGDKIIGDETDNSLFTHFLVKGLKGEADKNRDGNITVDELYEYAYEQIVNLTPNQTPGKWSYKQQGEIVLRNGFIHETKQIQQTQERANTLLEVKPKTTRPVTEKKPAVPRPSLRIGNDLLPKLKIPAAVLSIMVIGYLAFWGLKKLNSPTPAETISPQITSTATGTILIEAPQSVQSPTPAPTEIIPTPTLGIGSMLLSEKDGMTLVYVPAGSFSMGISADEAFTICQKYRINCSLEAYRDGEPVRVIDVSAFWIDQTEVTNKLYAACVNDGECQQPVSTASNTRSLYFGNPEYDDYPVIFVNWEMANDYCVWAGRRLPTEAEWEKAARGTTGQLYPWGGEEPNNNLLNFYKESGDIIRVKSFENGKSPYGAYDMAGNVWEWVNDWYGETYYKESPSSNPQGPAFGNLRVYRGGSWINSADLTISAIRGGDDPSTTQNNLGFRCASSP
jgi:formylglycine-generating enzyme required for sulfatase activity